MCQKVVPRTVYRTGDMCICRADGAPRRHRGSGVSCEPLGPRAAVVFLSSVLLRHHGVCSGEETGDETGLPAVSVGPRVYQALTTLLFSPPWTPAWRTPSSSLLPSHETDSADGVVRRLGAGRAVGVRAQCCLPVIAPGRGRLAQKSGSVLGASDQAERGFIGPSTTDVPFRSLTRAVSASFLCCEAPLFPSVINKYFRG